MELVSDEHFESKFSVSFSYGVFFTKNVFDSENKVLKKVIEPKDKPNKVIVFVDEGVAKAWPNIEDKIVQYARSHQDLIKLVGQPIRVVGGETSKNSWEIVNKVLEMIERNGICKHAYVIAVGGGAVLDAVGLASTLAHRGVRLIRIPSTTLSQADSGMGVKNGINGFSKKNFIGTFAPPWAVINDEQLLETLSDRDWNSGFAEAIKVALLKDKDYFTQIELVAEGIARRDLSVSIPVIRRAAKLHAEHISGGGDPFEMRSSRPLDFGHWSAHKLEEMSEFSLKHGEAVAIGVALDTVLSTLEYGLPKSDTDRILSCITAVGLPCYSKFLEDTEALKVGLEQFREHLGGDLVVSMLEGIGKPIDVNKINFKSVIQAVEQLKLVDSKQN